MLPVISSGSAESYRIIEDKTYVQRASGPLKGDLYLPAGSNSMRPGVVMIHGGGWSDGATDDMNRFAEEVVSAGFVVFNVTYRLAPEHKFPAQLEDVRDAVRWLRASASDYNVDPGRIGAWGYSAGAHLAMLLGTVDDGALRVTDAPATSARVAAVVAGAGPTDLREYPDNGYVTDLMPENADDAMFRLASPIASVTGDDAPMFLYHGRNDWIVAFRNSENMYRALQSAGVEARLKRLTFGHVISFLFGGGAVDDGIEFLRIHLDAAGS